MITANTATPCGDRSRGRCCRIFKPVAQALLQASRRGLFLEFDIQSQSFVTQFHTHVRFAYSSVAYRYGLRSYSRHFRFVFPPDTRELCDAVVCVVARGDGGMSRVYIVPRSEYRFKGDSRKPLSIYIPEGAGEYWDRFEESWGLLGVKG